MKAYDDITWNATDAQVAAAETDFGYDSRPLMAGEAGAGVFACTCGKVGCLCDVDDYADIDSQLAALGF